MRPRRSLGETQSRFELEGLLNETRSRIEEERKVIARREAIGADLTESLELLRNLETTAVLRERRLCYLRQWRDFTISLMQQS